MSYEQNHDRIVYVVVTAPGGVDGSDRHEPGGREVEAFFDKAEAQAKVGKDDRYLIEPRVIDITQARADILARLTPTERLVLFPPASKVKRGLAPASGLPDF